ncbi:CvpA family protein [Planctomycetota bacterium]
MAFWIGIITGLAFAFYAVKRGFYEMWAIMFNLVISIYIGIFLRPTIADFFPAISDSDYGIALTILITAAAAFVILQGIAFLLFGQFSIPFPKIFDTLGAGILGFLAGFLIWNFVCLLVGITPLPQNAFMKTLGFAAYNEQSKSSYLTFWADSVNVFSSSGEHDTEKLIGQFVKEVEESKKAKTRILQPLKPAEPNEPKLPQGPTIEQQLGPPPEPDFEII